MKKIRVKNRDKFLFIAGGPHPTGVPEGTLEMGFDYVFRYEAEESFKKFIKSIIEGKDIEDIKGIAYFRDGVYRFSGRPEFCDINRYSPFSLKLRVFGPIEITRGCPFSCYFCQTPRIFGTRVRHRSIENVLKYVEVMVKNCKTDIRFISPNAFSYGSSDGKDINICAIEELLKGVKDMIRDRGRIFFGTFPSEVRPEHVEKETLELLVKYADNDSIVIGAQSGSDRVLESIHRGHTVSDVLKAVRLCRRYGIRPDVDFIFGFPGEDDKDVKETIKVMESIIKEGGRVHAHFLLPLPQTPFANKKPTGLNKKLKDFIRKYFPYQVVFGSFAYQEKLANKIYTYFSKDDNIRT
jgi:B12-binding domain/radical SAM domain protein